MQQVPLSGLDVFGIRLQSRTKCIYYMPQLSERLSRNWWQIRQTKQNYEKPINILLGSHWVHRALRSLSMSQQFDNCVAIDMNQKPLVVWPAMSNSCSHENVTLGVYSWILSVFHCFPTHFSGPFAIAKWFQQRQHLHWVVKPRRPALKIASASSFDVHVT